MRLIEESILQVLLKEPRKKFTVESIAKEISSKKAGHSRASIFRYCNTLLKQNILASEDIGKMKQITLNFNDDETLALLAQIETRNKNRFLEQLQPVLREYFLKLSSPIKRIHEIHSILLFGSYAKGKQRADSDLDFMFLIQKPHAIHDDKTIKISIKKTKDLINAALHDANPYLGDIKISPVIIEIEDYKKGIKENKIDVVTE